MASFKFTYGQTKGRKWTRKNLVSIEKSSYFALANVNLRNYQ